MIRWRSTIEGDVEYSIVYSADGRRFDREIASKLTACEYTWSVPDSRTEPACLIKVKAYKAGYLMAESVVPVSFVPRNALVVSKADQKVYHFSEGKLVNVFTCSTALPQYDLDPGVYKVYMRSRKHWSKLYEVWMPHSLFFHRGYALHATNMIKQLGRPASHGCVRLHPNDAETLYGQVDVGTPVVVLPKTQECSLLADLYTPERPDSGSTITSASR